MVQVLDTDCKATASRGAVITIENIGLTRTKSW